MGRTVTERGCTIKTITRITKLARFLAERFQQHRYARLYASFVLVITGSLLLAYFSSDRVPQSGGRQVFLQRDFSNTPFGLMDAYDACLLETQAKQGASFLRAHMLPLSTRYDELKNTYLIVLSADVGTHKEWSGVMVYCTIDPRAQDISYYKEVYDEPPSFLRKSMSALSRLFE